ncbi:MAG: Ig-like domain-containing protein, partial [Gammaproteobacteria bacterium]|nr:Ig-like domain-containing protein [Gammaproteobacteria bacterium]
IVELDVVPPATTLFSLGDTIRLVASGVDANGHHGPALAVTWMSEHDAVATVDSNGLVTAVRTGSTDVFATTGELRDSAGVTVAQLATEVRVTPEADTLAIGDTLLLSAVALDGNGHVVEDTDYVWSTSNPAAVAVDDSGLVTALGPGTGTIRAQATRAGANYVGTATITVLASSAGGGRADP